MHTTGWTSDELVSIGAADELQIASSRNDATFVPYATIRVADDDLYVRSYPRMWRRMFRYALQRRKGRIRAGGLERNAAFEEPDDSVHPAIDRPPGEVRRSKRRVRPCLDHP
jgi:hypothetical protein